MKEKTYHWLFTIGIWVKGMDGLLETIGGVMFLIAGRMALSSFIWSLTQEELLEDPDDWIAQALRHAFGHLSFREKLFGGIYLLAHGGIKIMLVAGLLRGRRWSYPVAIAILSVFIGYQIYRLIVRQSPALACLTGFDAIIVALIWREYKRAKLGGSSPLEGRKHGEK